MVNSQPLPIEEPSARMRREGYSRLVCMYVCHAHAILAVRAIKSVTKDTVVLNVRFAAIL